MYQSFYGLREPPFELTSNPEFLFYTGQHREALSNLEYGLMSAKAITVLIGEAGTGKTTLLRAALESERCRAVSAIFVHNPTLTRVEFVEMIASQFQLGSNAEQSKTSLLNALEPLLRARRTRGQQTVLVVDEAQSLSDELLEEIRLLANIETETEKLLPVVLAGQPELAARLNEPGLRQLKQRIALRCEIGPLSLEETAAYIASRVRKAGGDTTRLFTREAVKLIHHCSGGIPRTVNVMCENALISGFALGKRPVDRETVLEVCRDFDMPAGDDEPAPEVREKPSYNEREGTTRPDGTPYIFEKADRRSRVLAMLGLG
jgi:general secretion pathway protein A